MRPTWKGHAALLLNSKTRANNCRPSLRSACCGCHSAVTSISLFSVQSYRNVSWLIIHLTSSGFRSVLDKGSNPMWSRKPCPAFVQCCPPHLTLFSHLFRILSKDTMPRWSQHSYFLFAPEAAQFSILSTEEHFSFVSRIGYDFPGHVRTVKRFLVISIILFNLFFSKIVF